MGVVILHVRKPTSENASMIEIPLLFCSGARPYSLPVRPLGSTTTSTAFTAESLKLETIKPLSTISPVVLSYNAKDGALRYDLPPKVTSASITLLAFLILTTLGKNASGFRVLSDGYPYTSVGTLISCSKLIFGPISCNSALIPLFPIDVTAGNLSYPNPPLIKRTLAIPPVAPIDVVV